MYEVLITTKFSAAHQLRGYDGEFERLHGHNWGATILVEAKELDGMEVGIDFVALKKQTDKILGRLDYQNINEVAPFDKLNPSAENIARWLFESLSEELNTENAKVKRVQINETDAQGAAYFV
jgi:6-pyruvoyltetrahydropterin/6-carboxytetrahydropterin synthase